MALGKILDRKTNMEQCLSCEDSRFLSSEVWRLETEQAIKLLPHKHEDPSADLQQPPNKHMVAHACKYRTVRWGWRLENSQDLRSAGLVHVVKFLTTERPHSKSKVECLRAHTQDCHLITTCIPWTWTLVPTGVPTHTIDCTRTPKKMHWKWKKASFGGRKRPAKVRRK